MASRARPFAPAGIKGANRSKKRKPKKPVLVEVDAEGSAWRVAGRRRVAITQAEFVTLCATEQVILNRVD